MKIYNGHHCNMECIVMEKDNLVLKVIPELGFKVSSLVYREHEFLFQPSKMKYELPDFGDSFSSYDTSGLDEMIPTIDSCIYEGKQCLPDHGDVWTLPWNVMVNENSIEGSVSLRSLPLKFVKKISMGRNNTIRMDYSVKNVSDKEQSYLWALHGLNNFDNDTEIMLPNGVNRVLDVINNEVIDKNIENLLYLRNYKDKQFYKFYLLDELSIGECGLYYKDKGLIYTIKFDKKVNPYLGVWITKGGFKGEYNCALEPSNGFYDSLKLAKENKKFQSIMPFEEKNWTVYIEISET